jgi:membrane protein
MSGDILPAEPAETPSDGGEPPAPGTPERRRLAGMRARVDIQKRRLEEQKRRLEAQGEALRSRHPSVRLAYDTYEGDRRQAGGLLAGGLAFRLFLWLLPTALVVVSGIGLVAQIGSSPTEEVAANAGLGAALASVVGQAAEQSGRGSIVLLLIGLWLMVWASMSVIKALRLLTSAAWRIPRPRLRRPILSGAVGSVIGIGLLALPYLVGFFYAGSFATDLFALIGVTTAVGAGFVWLSLWLPHPEDVRWPDVVPGAILFAIGTEGLRLVTAVYLVGRLARIDDLYGALGLSAVFLTWLYLIGRLIVAGMALNATRWRSRQASQGDTEAAETSPG